MPTLYVRDFPKELHDRLKERAADSHRSVTAEIIAIVERVLGEDDLTRQRLAALRGLDEVREQWTPPPGLVDSATLIREDRER